MSDMFKDFLARLNAIGDSPVTAYTEGNLSDFEKRHLYGISSIIMDEMRNALKE